MSKVVLITGASGDIGRATARLFAAKGYSVAVHYNQSERAALELEDELVSRGCRAKCFQADLSHEDQAGRMASLVQYHLGEVDVLVNNAGFAQQKLFLAMTPQDLKRMLDVHVMGNFYLCKRVLPAMIDRGGGAIVNVCSMWGQVGAGMEVGYSVAKGALVAMTKALAKEMGPSGVRVNAVSPGLIDTRMNSGIDPAALEELQKLTPLGRMGTAEEVAACILFLASDGASFITGQVLSPNGGLTV
ncbi:MAG: elongation factor P 5-aminopentanone reductase [Christensenellales bacterium]|jgi:3-oxoacyl-[acyl-carrier protein] reductase